MRVTTVICALAMLCTLSCAVEDEAEIRVVTPQWLADHVQDEDLRIVDMRGHIKHYWKSHIPNSVYIHPEALRMPQSGTPGMLMPPEILSAMLGRLGIDRNTMVVAVADRSDYAATYLLWALNYLGHPRSALLDGGFERWKNEGFSTSQDFPEIQPKDYEAPHVVEGVRASLEDVQAALADGQVVVDNRPEELYTGDKGPWSRLGHIEGAIHIAWDETVTEEGALKSEQELRALFQERGVTPDRRIIIYCGQGYSATHTWFTLKHILDYPDVANYDGSFSEWSNIDELPVATGTSPQ